MPRFSTRALFPTGRLARSTLVTSGWLTLRVVGQTVWLVLIARALGPSQYGLLAGITALAATAGTLTGLGFGVLMLQDASRNIEMFSTAWRRALIMSLVSGAILCLVYVFLAPHILPGYMNTGAYLAVGITELICFPIVITASYAFQTHERMGWAGILYVLIPVGNLIAFGMFACWSPTQDLIGYLPFHAALAVVTASTCIVMVQRILSPKPAGFIPTVRDMREGAGFSVMRLADTALNTLDKTLVLQLANSHMAGIYSAAYRLISVATLPLISLSMAVLPRLFRTDTSKNESRILVQSILVTVGIYGLLAFLGLWGVSGILPILLGEGFRSSVQVARWLAISPLLQGLYIVGANLLVTQQMLALRIASQLLAVGVLIVSAVVLIPMFGLPGAVAMILITQASATILIWLCYVLTRRGEIANTSGPSN